MAHHSVKTTFKAPLSRLGPLVHENRIFWQLRNDYPLITASQ